MARFEAEVTVSIFVDVEGGGEAAARGVIADWLGRKREGIATRIGHYFIKSWSHEVKRIEQQPEEMEIF